MNQTQNLGLPVYGANDKPSWMDTNNGFEKLDNIVGGAAGVQLDFANPLHVFTQSNNTYTATQTCWLFGSFIAADNAYGYVTVDGTRVAGTYDANIGYPAAFIPPIRIEAGSVIAVANLGPDTYPARQCLAVYPGEIISDAFVWNEAIVELDYGNPLYTFTAGGSYTCEKRCWMIGTCMNTAVSVNGKRIADGSSGYYSNIPLTPLSKGDVINVTTGGTGINIQVLDGTIKGSSPGFAGSGDVLELLDFDNAVAVINAGAVTTYTAPKAGALYGAIATAQSGYVTVDGKQVAKFNANEPIPFLEVQGIQKGSVITATGTPNNTSYVYFVPYKYESIAPEITVYNEAEVELDYANPLHTFTTGNLTYTATEECYLFGQLWSASGQNELTINGVPYYRGYYSSPTIADAAIVYPIKLKAGDIVAVQNYANLLHVLKGTKVGSVGQLNPAPKPDYNTAIAELTGASGSYTCTKDCFAQIGLLGSNGSAPSFLKVNDHKVAVAFTTNTTNLNLDLKQGDVISWSDMGTASTFINIFDYLS